MLKETILTVQTYDLKVDINCDECVKELEKIMHKIDGIYQTNISRQQGKVTLIGLLDMDTVFKKLKKAGMSPQLWDANSDVVSKDQKPQLGGSDRGDQLKDTGGKVLPQGEASSNGGCGARTSGGTNDATMVQPQLTLTPEQHLPSIQQQIEQRLWMLNREKLPPQPMGMPPSIKRGGKHSGKKIGGGTKVLVPGNPNNDNKNDVGKQVKNDAIGQPPHISDLHSYGGGAVHGLGMPVNSLAGKGFYPRSAGSSGMDMMQQVTRNPTPQQPYRMVLPQQEHEMMMNTHFFQTHNAHNGPDCTRYQLMGYNGHGHLQQQYPPPMYYPMPLPPQHDNIFSDENPNICSLM